MDEIYSSNTKATTKQFLVSALILEGSAVVIMIALLLSLRFFTPEFFKNIKNFYVENVCFSVTNEIEEGKQNSYEI